MFDRFQRTGNAIINNRILKRVLWPWQCGATLTQISCDGYQAMWRNSETQHTSQTARAIGGLA